MHVVQFFLGQITCFEVLWKCHQMTIQKMSQFPSKCIKAFERLFSFWVPLNTYVERQEGKIRKCLSFMLKYFKITVCCFSSLKLQEKLNPGYFFAFHTPLKSLIFLKNCCFHYTIYLSRWRINLFGNLIL